MLRCGLAATAPGPTLTPGHDLSHPIIRRREAGMSLSPAPREPHGPLGVVLAWLVALSGIGAILYLILIYRGVLS
jgi:hypothetical protein